MEKLPLELTKALHMRFMSIFGEKFSKLFASDAFIQIWWEEWSQGMAGINPKHIKVALDYCRMNLEWPPSIAEFRKICEQAAGVLPWETAFDLAVRSGDLTDPNVRATYDRIGSWAMTHDKEVDLRRKFKTTYEDILAQGRVIANEASNWRVEVLLFDYRCQN
jgi:hypothetical protein